MKTPIITNITQTGIKEIRKYEGEEQYHTGLVFKADMKTSATGRKIYVEDNCALQLTASSKTWNNNNCLKDVAAEMTKEWRVHLSTSWHVAGFNSPITFFNVYPEGLDIVEEFDTEEEAKARFDELRNTAIDCQQLLKASNESIRENYTSQIEMRKRGW